jgi:hypothetical protein
VLPPEEFSPEQVEDVKRQLWKQLWKMHITVLVEGGKR